METLRGVAKEERFPLNQNLEESPDGVSGVPPAEVDVSILKHNSSGVDPGMLGVAPR